MGAHCQDKPTRHSKAPAWYAFKLHKAAGCSTWRFLFGAQHMQQEKLPQFLRSFLLAQEPVLAQIAAESPAEEVTLYILGPKKEAVGVCSQQWQVSRPSRVPHSSGGDTSPYSPFLGCHGHVIPCRRLLLCRQ